MKLKIVQAAGKVINYSGGFIDRFVGRLISRKLAVWAVATGGLYYGMLTSSDWVAISLVYIGSQAAVDMITAYRNSG